MEKFLINILKNKVIVNVYVIVLQMCKNKIISEVNPYKGFRRMTSRPLYHRFLWCNGLFCFDERRGVMRQIKSKERVAKHGEVFTNEREVKAMLDLVKDETNKIDSTFLEPACGDGNFLVEIIHRKLAFIGKCKKPNYKRDQPEYEKAMLRAVGSIYGIDIMQDNVKECVARLYKVVCDEYEKQFKDTYLEDVEHCIRYILSRNIVCGNARTMKDYKGNPIVFSEWKNR